MTTRIGFYHLFHWPLDKALPKLLEKVLASGQKAVVMAGSEERVEYLNSLLWTYDPASWLPHGSRSDGDAALQPVWLTDQDENPNQATVLILTDGVMTPMVEGFERCLDLFDGRDPLAVEAARNRWRIWKAAGHDLTYLQQTERGGWEEKARSPAQTSDNQGD